MSRKFDVVAVFALVATMAVPGFASAQEGFAGYSSALGLLDRAGSWPQPKMGDLKSNGLRGFRQGVFNSSVHGLHMGTIRDTTTHNSIARN
jgi:hypothetical protein